jgi:hypothetical protein
MSHKINPEVDQLLLAPIPELHYGYGWHRLGTPNEDWSIENLKKTRVLFSHSYATAGMYGVDGFIPTKQKYAVAGDTGLPIGGAVGEDWDTPQNAEFYEMFTDALAGSNYKVCSCGTIDNRVEFFIDAKGEAIEAANRTISPYVGLHRMFGGRGPIRCSGHSTVIQCGNTSAIFLAEAEKSATSIGTKNSKFVSQRMGWFKQQIEKVHGVHAEFARAMDLAENEPISSNEATLAFVGVLAPEKLSTRTVNRVNRVRELFSIGDGNRGQTVADWYNAITDYYTHESSGNPAESDNVDALRVKQYYSSEFGPARQFKAEITSNLFRRGEPNMEAFVDWQARGRVIIDRSENDFVASLVF